MHIYSWPFKKKTNFHGKIKAERSDSNSLANVMGLFLESDILTLCIKASAEILDFGYPKRLEAELQEQVSFDRSTNCTNYRI